MDTSGIYVYVHANKQLLILINHPWAILVIDLQIWMSLEREMLEIAYYCSHKYMPLMSPSMFLLTKLHCIKPEVMSDKRDFLLHHVITDGKHDF